MKAILPLLILISAILVGCSTDDERYFSYEKSSYEVKAGVSYKDLSIESQTRAPYFGTIDTNGSLVAQVYASLSATSFQFPISNGTITFTAQGTAQSTAKGYNTPVYYPVNGSPVYLTGLYPSTAWSLDTSGGYDSFTAAIDGKSDLMASPKVSTTVADAKASPTEYKNLAFSHALTLLDLEVKAKDAATAALWGNITSAKVVGVMYDNQESDICTSVTWNTSNNTYSFSIPSSGGTPFYGYNSTDGYTDTPISSTQTAPLAAGNAVHIGYALVQPTRTDRTGAKVSGYKLAITTENKSAEIVVKLDFGLTPPTQDDTQGQRYTLTLNFDQQAVTTIYRIPIPDEFKPSYTNNATTLGQLLTTRTYIVYDPEDATRTRKIAEIDLEYIYGFSETVPAVVVYEMEYDALLYPNGRRKLTGTIANNGARANWSGVTKGQSISEPEGFDAAGGDYSSLYSTTGQIASFHDYIYYNPSQDKIVYTDPGGTYTDWDPTAYNFKDWLNNEYPVVKIGQQYYTASNLRASTFSNSAPMPTGTCPVYVDLPGYNTGTYDIDGNAFNDLKNFGRYYDFSIPLDTRMDYQGWRVPLTSDVAIMDWYVEQSTGSGAPKLAYPVISTAMLTYLSGDTSYATPTNLTGLSLIWTIPVRTSYPPDPELFDGGAVGTSTPLAYWVHEIQYGWAVYTMRAYINTDPPKIYEGLGAAADAEDMEETNYYHPIRMVVNDYLP